MGLLIPVAVDIHPDPEGTTKYEGVHFENQGLTTNWPFNQAYKAANEFTKAWGKYKKGAGFMKTLMLQRLCSSFASGRETARRLLDKTPLEEDEIPITTREGLSRLSTEEETHLKTIIDALSRKEANDPKLMASLYFLTKHRTNGKTWLEHGCIVFSQYYDTVRTLADAVAVNCPNEKFAVYAGAGKSRIHSNGTSASVEREAIKKAVADHELRLIIATDAACEGLNLQTLGTMINIDLPWNPSRLEQRLGRIKRFGQVRPRVDMLNLAYHETHDEKIYEALSKRMRDRYDIFGTLPDTIDDEWIENIEKLDELMDEHERQCKAANNAFNARYKDKVDPDGERWERCARVLSQNDVIERLSKPQTKRWNRGVRQEKK